MATPLDSAINQHIQSLKASGPPMPMPVGPAPHMPPPGWGVPPHLMPGAQMMVQMPPGHPMQPPMMMPGMPSPHPHPGTMPMPGVGPPGPSGPGPTTVCVAIDNLPFRYQLAEADLRDTFLRWGPLQNVQVIRNGPREVGIIIFADQIDAADAQRQLVGQNCNFDGAIGVLAVVIGSPEPLLRMPGPGFGLPPQVAQAQIGGCVPPGMIPGKGDGKGVFMLTNGVGALPGRPAWCCKIVVEAESLHPEFPTVARIIGEGGANLEHIRTQTKCNVQLRGRGSGQLEPDGQELKEEPMFLWLTSDNVASGQSALEMTQDLLNSVYDGHKQWCEQNSIMHPEFLKPKVFENPDPLPGAGGPGAIVGPGGKGGLPGKGPRPF